MKCENCNKDHDGEYGSGRFCSVKCARGFSTKANREEINKKRAVSNKIASEKMWQDDEYRKKMKVAAKKAYQKYLLRYDENLLSEEFEKLGLGKSKKRILLEQNKKCNRCGISEWQGEEIVLEIEHKNGNHNDNKRDNLECLCPNCHSLTPTFRGRNKKVKRNLISDKEIIDAFIETGNIRQALIKLGLAAKGDNYGKVKRALSLKGIPY